MDGRDKRGKSRRPLLAQRRPFCCYDELPSFGCLYPLHMMIIAVAVQSRSSNLLTLSTSNSHLHTLREDTLCGDTLSACTLMRVPGNILTCVFFFNILFYIETSGLPSAAQPPTYKTSQRESFLFTPPVTYQIFQLKINIRARRILPSGVVGTSYDYLVNEFEKEMDRLRIENDVSTVEHSVVHSSTWYEEGREGREGGNSGNGLAGT
ncbi:hypothetical protein KQX54_009046 [Cotesia glomerata]|uniref:Uncharacterized protein n=1 Tax=Cotesia glomerata TaxID=32391 RepID=A0AAV7I4Z0_COTGL|nr:hypothetical protein KQX54_009046 [Cotesia glomerata]